MALNLIRNSRVFFTTNVNATTGVIADNGFTADNAATSAWELQVLDGFSFSQNTNSEQITVSEAGATPVRGQRSFNTSLAPVDFSFSTYIRPRLDTDVKCEESVLWNALLGTDRQNTSITPTTTGTLTATYAAADGELTIAATTISGFSVGQKYLINGITSTAPADLRLVNGPATVKTVSAGSIVFTMDNQSNAVAATAAATAGTLTATNVKFYTSAWGIGSGGSPSIVAGHRSNTNNLQKFGMLIIVDGVTYAIDNCALNEATIDFGLDGIATVQWTGQATALRQRTHVTASGGSFTAGGSSIGSYNQKNTSAGFITNKLSTCKLKTTKGLGAGTVGTGYYLALTGGSITISNNITYITPAILGVVNEPATYFTGTRSVTGTLNCYLNTGTISTALDGVTYTKGSGDLIADMLTAKTTETEPMFGVELAIGGVAATVKAEIQLPSVSLGIPAINTEQVVTTSINFTAAASKGSYTSRVYDLAETNEITVRYYA